MADPAPWFILMNPHDDARGPPSSNTAMVEGLVQSRNLHSTECSDAFLAIDRRSFWPEGNRERELIYADMPLRCGRLHLSAPHIYAKALESLMPLKPGMSFLNVGSGTGYFNSLVSELIGGLATNHGIDIWPDTVAHARRSVAALGKESISFTVGNVYQLDVGSTMRYDRIYLGACANSRSKYLYRLLEVGGILIGPFQAGHSQQLRRVVRQTETHFQVEVLGSVQFASLVDPPDPPTPRPSAHRAAPPIASFARGSRSSSATSALTQAPVMFSLNERPWTRERASIYPESFRRTVLMGLMCRPRDSSMPSLPAEIWVNHIFPLCPRGWFEPIATRATAYRAFTGASARMAFSPSARSPAKAEGADDSDDGSTRAPSSRASSTQVTPQTEPSQPPADIEAEMGQIEAGEPFVDPGQGTLFEVFDNGQRHAIGTEGDPDDMELEPPRLFVPADLMRLLGANRRRRRRERDVEEEVMEDEGSERGDEPQEERSRQGNTEEAGDSDEEMMPQEGSVENPDYDDEDEDGAGVDEDGDETMI